MKRYFEYVLLLLFLLSLTLVWAIIQENRKPYKQYQRVFQARKMEQLRALEVKEPSPEKREEIRKQVEALTKLPALQEVTLKGGQKERCTTCHIGIEQISDSHPVETFGCVICHGGDPLSVTLPAAHRGLIGGRNPSEFAVVDRGCGQTMPDGTACHSGDPAEERDHIQRVKTTIMATKAGEIANPRYTFGAQKSLHAMYGVASIQGKDPVDPDKTVKSLLPLPFTGEADLPVDPAGNKVTTDRTGAPYTFSGHRVDTQLQQKCMNQCHLWISGGQEKYLSRASGCAACHYLYDEQPFYRGDDPTISRDKPGHGAVHQFTLKIPYSQCNHCHNRGVHNLLTMGFDRRADLEKIQEVPTDQRRVQDYYQPMTLFTLCEYKLDCVDCHTDQEVMGDGFLYIDKIAQQRVRCKTCHGTLLMPPIIRKLTDKESPKVQRIMRSYSRDPGEEALFSAEGEILPHVRLEGGRLVLTGKVTGHRFDLPQVYGSACTQDPQVQDANSCHACHDIHLKGHE